MLYQLMNKDTVVATYEEKTELGIYGYEEVERLHPYLPYGFIDINDWIDGRQIAKHRVPIERLMRELGLTTRHDFIAMARCLSLTDTFWMSWMSLVPRVMSEAAENRPMSPSVNDTTRENSAERSS